MTPAPRFYPERRLISNISQGLFDLLTCTGADTSYMLMEEITSMFLSLGRLLSPHGIRTSSTLEVLTLISNRYVGLLRRLSTTPERTMTSFMNTARDLENLELLSYDVMTFGQTLSLNQHVMNFCNTCGMRLHEITCFILTNLSDSRTDFSLRPNPFTPPPTLRRSDSQAWPTGLNSPESEETTDEEE